MNETRVTTTGLEGVRPEREASAGGTGRPGGRNRGGRRRGEQMMVPKARFTSYYGQPVLNEPTWEARDIAGYFFLGGLAGASSIAAALAGATGRRTLARNWKLAAAGGVSLSAVALVHDLGKPSRFFNMLRVLKPTSPMSVGSWLLAGYGPAVAVAAGTAVTGRFRVVGSAATAGAALLGAGVASYTGVLIADTAVPAWHDGFRELPFLFVSSAASAAGGFGLVTGPADEIGPARRLGTAGGVAEIALTRTMEHRMGMTGEPYREGKAGQLMKAAEVLTAVGAVGAAFAAGRSKVAAKISGAALLAGSAATRFGVFHAGVQSSKDPKYVVEPQRARLGSAGEGNGGAP